MAMKLFDCLKKFCKMIWQNVRRKQKSHQKPVESGNYFNNSSAPTCGCRGGLWKL